MPANQFSNYPGGFSHGVTIRGIPIVSTRTGNVFYVSSGSGNDSGAADGSITKPFATLQYAKGRCTANNGDTVFGMPGHAETISNATTLTLTVADIAYIGLGTGSRRPTLTFDTAIGANIPVSAANNTFHNFLFVANFADITSFITIAAAPEFCVDSCEFRDTSSVLNALKCVTTTVTVNADGLRFTNNTIQSLATTAATTMILVAGTMSRLTINDNFYTGAVLNNTAALLNHGALAVTNLEMARNRVSRPNTDTATGGILIVTSSTANTGMVYDNKIGCLDAAGIILMTAGCDYAAFNNLVTGTVDLSGFLLPAADTDA